MVEEEELPATSHLQVHHLLSSCTDAGRAAWSGRSTGLHTRAGPWPGSACGGPCGSASCARFGSGPSEESAGGRCTVEEFPRGLDARMRAVVEPWWRSRCSNRTVSNIYQIIKGPCWTPQGPH